MKKLFFVCSMATAAAAFGSCSDTCDCEDCTCATYHRVCTQQCAPARAECSWECTQKYARGITVSGDFLYWFAKETGLIYAIENETVPVLLSLESSDPFVAVTPRKIFAMKERWNPGFRVTLALHPNCDMWDIRSTWTLFKTEKKQKISVDLEPFIGDELLVLRLIPKGKSLTSPWTQSIFQVSQDLGFANFYNRIEAKWRLELNIVDIELGKHYWLSPCISMRPYIGARSVLTETHFTTVPILAIVTMPGGDFEDLDVLTDVRSDLQFKNNFWGSGIIGGFQPRWYFGCGFNLFGNIDAALLWGYFNLKQTAGVQFSIGAIDVPIIAFSATIDYGTVKYKFSAMQAILDLGIGLGWDTTFSCDRYLFGLDVGWEHHIWFDHNHRQQLRGSSFHEATTGVPVNASSYDSLDEIYGNLLLAGFTLRARLEF